MLDSSAIVAVLRAETDAPAFSGAIAAAARCRVSAANYVEAAIVIDSSRSAISSRRFDDFFRTAGVVVETVTPRQAEIARQAYRDFGKGRHKAGLNFGDCFSYALAKEMDEPLLFKGTDFARTDVEVAEILKT
jgi:ribonuclease VapC